jgi:uncharacterized protein YhaN
MVSVFVRRGRNGARLHLTKVVEDDSYTEADALVVCARIWNRLEPEFETLQEDIQTCREFQKRELKAFTAIEAKPTAEKTTQEPAPAQGTRQQIVKETLAQLQLLEQEIYELRVDLPRCIKPSPTPGYWP